MKAKVELLAPIRHDKKSYEKGDVVVMSEAQAERLVSLGFAKITETIEDDESGETQTQAAKTGGVSKSIVTPLVTQPVTITPNKSNDVLTDPRDPEYMTAEELKHELSALGLPHKANANKIQLLDMYLRATGKK
jgi:hypothetical protein